MLRADKSAVLIPQRLGRTNIDFVDEHGNLMGSMDVRVVRQSINDRVVIYDRPSLGAIRRSIADRMDAHISRKCPTRKKP